MAVRSATEKSERLEMNGLGTYTLIPKWGFPKTYGGKIMLVVFLGTHAPLLGTALYLLLGSPVAQAAAHHNDRNKSQSYEREASQLSAFDEGLAAVTKVASSGYQAHHPNGLSLPLLGVASV